MFIRLNPRLQDYSWGTTSFIPDFLSFPASSSPVAEAWWGDHLTVPLLEKPLPYLVKILSAAHPLSLQVHPSYEGALRGKEAFPHLFTDTSAKPELLVALTRFDALSGFRPLEESRSLLSSEGFTKLVDLLPDSLEEAIPLLLDLTPAEVDHLLVPSRLLESFLPLYAGDPGLLIALLMNHVILNPGEGLFTPAGQVHSYLQGSAVEVMAASDNTLRAGLTSKVVDKPAFLSHAILSPVTPQVLQGPKYHVPTPEFSVRIAADEHVIPTCPTLLLPLSEVRLDREILRRGEAVLLQEEVYLTGGPVVLVREGEAAWAS